MVGMDFDVIIKSLLLSWKLCLLAQSLLLLSIRLINFDAVGTPMERANLLAFRCD